MAHNDEKNSKTNDFFKYSGEINDHGRVIQLKKTNKPFPIYRNLVNPAHTIRGSIWFRA